MSRFVVIERSEDDDRQKKSTSINATKNAADKVEHYCDVKCTNSGLRIALRLFQNNYKTKLSLSQTI